MKHLTIWLLAAVGCASPSSGESQDRIEVAESNALGVASLELTRSAGNGDTTFELRALDANDHEVASIERRVGIIADPGGETAGGIGSEMSLTVAGATTRIKSYAPEEFLPVQHDPSLKALLDIKAVLNELAREHVFVLANRPGASSDPSGISSDRSYGAWGCSASSLQASGPQADQCCEDYNVTYYWDGYQWVEYSRHSELHVPHAGGNQGHLIGRTYNQYGYTCRKYDGVTACTSGKPPQLGGDCWYGPSGWAIEIDLAPSGGTFTVTSYYDQIFYDYVCGYAMSGSPTFANVTGTLASGACPTGTTANAVYWQNATAY